MLLKEQFKKLLLDYCLEEKPSEESMSSAFYHIQELLLGMIENTFEMHKEEIITDVIDELNRRGIDP